MTVLDASLCDGPRGGYANPCVTSDLSSFGFDAWPAHQVDVGRGWAGKPTRVDNTVHSHTIGLALSRSYKEDFYYRVHVLPAQLDLGQLTTAQQRTVVVWNAWPTTSLTLQDVTTTGAEGINIVAPGDLPLTFKPLQERVWTVNITPNGPGIIDAVLQWTFAGGAKAPDLVITGDRLTAWTILPDWSNSIDETLLWLTDVGEAVAGDQDRVPVRDAPRRQWEAQYIAYDKDRQIAESLLYGVAARNYVVPVWWDGDVLASALAAGATSLPVSTADCDYAVGSQVLLRRTANQYELVEVDSIETDAVVLARPTVNDWPAGTQVWPCRQAALTDFPKITRKSDWLAGIPIRFEAREPCDWTAVAPSNTYLGIPVLELRPNEVDDLQAAYPRKLEQLDNQVAFPAVDDISGFAWPTQSHPFLIHGRSNNGAFRSLLYWLAGRANALWVPTWQNDLTLTGPLDKTATTMNVRWAGVTRYTYGLPGRKHLRIELLDGTVFYRKVTATQEVGQTSETLALDTALGVAVTPGAIRDISWMALCTLAGDSVELQHVTDAAGLTGCTASFAAVPAEEP